MMLSTLALRPAFSQRRPQAVAAARDQNAPSLQKVGVEHRNPFSPGARPNPPGRGRISSGEADRKSQRRGCYIFLSRTAGKMAWANPPAREKLFRILGFMR